MRRREVDHTHAVMMMNLRTILTRNGDADKSPLNVDDATPPIIVAQHPGRETIPRRRGNHPRGDETRERPPPSRQDSPLLVVDMPLLNVHHVVIVLQQGMILLVRLANRVIVDQHSEMIYRRLVVLGLHQSNVGHRAR